MIKYTGYNFGHDEWDASTKALEKHLAVKIPSQRHRAPYGFGPAPGPRQPLGLSSGHGDIQALRKSNPERFTTYTVRFSSSRTFLQNLLPPGFAFTSPATVVKASISCTTLNGMAWLGGSGYNLVQLTFHGVNYTKKDRSKVFGSYVPVLFENLADPIITGRDDVGFPKLFSDIDVVEENGSNVTIDLRWRSVDFGRIQLQDLKEEENVPSGNGNAPAKPAAGPPPPPPEQGTFVYRYVPAVGEPGKADAEYAVLCPYPPSPTPGEGPSKSSSKSATVAFSSGGWQKLPTLHHIVQKLADMPIYGIDKAEKVMGEGVDDLSGANRIE